MLEFKFNQSIRSNILMKISLTSNNLSPQINMFRMNFFVQENGSRGGKLCH